MTDRDLAPHPESDRTPDRTGLFIMLASVVLAVAIAAGAVIAAGGPVRPAGAAEPTGPAVGAAMPEAPQAAHDAWLDALRGRHRQLFDAPAPDGGIPLLHVLNYYDTYNRAYLVPDRDVNAILTFYGATTLYGLNDAMWKKYALGEFLKVTDARTGAAATTNPWHSAPQVLGSAMPQASIASLKRRGATFLLCNNALDQVAARVAQARGLAAAAVEADFEANALEGVTLVPAMVIAIEKAQARGIAYRRQ